MPACRGASQRGLGGAPIAREWGCNETAPPIWTGPQLAAHASGCLGIQDDRQLPSDRLACPFLEEARYPRRGASEGREGPGAGQPGPSWDQIASFSGGARRQSTLPTIVMATA